MDVVVDASVAVKWFNTEGEDNVELALKIQTQKTENIIMAAAMLNESRITNDERRFTQPSPSTHEVLLTLS